MVLESSVKASKAWLDKFQEPLTQGADLLGVVRIKNFRWQMRHFFSPNSKLELLFEQNQQIKLY